MGICLSHSRTLRLVSDLGYDFDGLVKIWKKRQEIVATEYPVDDDQESSDEVLSESGWVTEEESEESTAIEFSTGIILIIYNNILC